MPGDLAVATVLFIGVVSLIVARIIDEVAAALAGVVLMIVLLNSYTVDNAFEYIDWDILAILFGMWIITGYMIEGGLAEWVVAKLLLLTRSYRILLILLAAASGLLSILVDNVIVILVFGSVAIRLAKKAGGDPVLAVILVGLSSNFMGTALLMGDLPPQLLHSIGGMEFLDFIVWRGAPSSFPLLLTTFLIVLLIYYRLVVGKEPARPVNVEGHVKVNGLLLGVSSLYFAATITGMALRPRLGVPLGFITVTGAALLAVTIEAARRALPARGLPSFSEILADVEWRALLFYASLFPLVGGLEASGVLERAAEWMVHRMVETPLQAYSVAYWLVAGLSTIVEHDALLMTFLYLIKEAAPLLPLDPRILYWGMAWSATLASNLTTAAAPALYVAVTLAEKEAGKRLSGRDFIRYSGPFVAASLAVHYLITILLWLPLVT